MSVSRIRGALLGLAGLLCIVQPAWNQDRPLKFSAQLHAGFSSTQVHGDQISGFNKFGISAGATLDIRRFDYAGFQWGLFYTQKGSRRVPDTKNGDFNSWRYRFTYIDLPLSKVWNPDPRWWWGVGLQPSILVAGEEDFYGAGYDELTYLELNPIDWGGILQLGFTDGGKRAVEVRFSQSLLPISERPDQPIARWDNFMMNMALQWLLTWKLG